MVKVEIPQVANLHGKLETDYRPTPYRTYVTLYFGSFELATIDVSDRREEFEGGPGDNLTDSDREQMEHDFISKVIGEVLKPLFKDMFKAPEPAPAAVEPVRDALLDILDEVEAEQNHNTLESLVVYLGALRASEVQDPHPDLRLNQSRQVLAHIRQRLHRVRKFAEAEPSARPVLAMLDGVSE